MMGAATLSVPAFAASGLMPLWALLALLPAPMTVRAIATALRYHDDPPRLLPANVATIVVHLATGVLLAVGLVLGPG